MTARETLWLHGRLYGLGGRALHERIAALLESAGLAERARSPVSTLSGGMKRRLELARVLLPSPELILLDEPTTGLDPDAEAALWARLLEANRAGATVVLATNKVNEAEKHCDRVAFIHRGRLAAEGSPAELKAGLKRDAVWVEWPDFTPALAEEIGAWEGVGRLTWAHPTLHATVDAASAFVPRLFQAAACAALLQRDIRAVLRSRSQLYSSMLFPLMLLAILGTGVSEGLDPSLVRDG